MTTKFVTTSGSELFREIGEFMNKVWNKGFNFQIYGDLNQAGLEKLRDQLCVVSQAIDDVLDSGETFDGVSIKEIIDLTRWFLDKGIIFHKVDNHLRDGFVYAVLCKTKQRIGLIV